MHFVFKPQLVFNTMTRLQIKVRIANRHYPMRISDKEEGLLRRAAVELNEAMALCQKQFSGADTQDLLAMVAFDQMVKRARRENEVTADQSKLLAHFGVMQKALNSVIGDPEQSDASARQPNKDPLDSDEQSSQTDA